MMNKKFSLHVDLDAFIPATDKEKEYMVKISKWKNSII